MSHLHDPDRSAWLESVMDNEDIAALMSATTAEEIADAWCCYKQRSLWADLSYEDPDWWAVQLWMEDWEDNDVARECFLVLVERAPDSLLDYVGAGPLEGFISSDESRVAWVEHQAARSAKFRKALANVWTWGRQTDEVANRTEMAAGVRLARPTGWEGP